MSKLLFQEGFDLHTYNHPATFDDWGKFWAQNAAQAQYISFVDGYPGVDGLSPGGAMLIDGNGGVVVAGVNAQGSSMQPALGAETEARLGAWFKCGPDNANSNAKWGPLLGLHLGGDGTSIILEVDGLGQWRGCHVTGGAGTIDSIDELSPGDYLTTGATQATDLLDEVWRPVQIYANIVTGVATVKVGITEITLSFTPAGGLGGTFTPNIAISAYDVGSDYFSVAWDHIWLTDGDEPAQIAGVSVDFGHAGGATSSITPFLIMGGTTFNGAALTTSASSATPEWQVNRYVWDTEPLGSTDWSTAAFDNIEYWGICYTGSGGTASVTNIALSILDARSGTEVLVNSVPPEVPDVTSGTWSKTDATKTFAAHINDLPRAEEADDDWITANASACIRFTPNLGSIAAPPPFSFIGLTFAEEFDTSYNDWVSVNSGLDFESYFISGFKPYGEGDKQFSSNYLTLNYEYAANSSAFVQGIWDYANDPNTGRYSALQQVMRKMTTGYTHQTTKLKIRGQGKALQFKVKSEDGKPFFINGWTVFVTGNKLP